MLFCCRICQVVGQVDSRVAITKILHIALQEFSTATGTLIYSLCNNFKMLLSNRYTQKHHAEIKTRNQPESPCLEDAKCPSKEVKPP